MANSLAEFTWRKSSYSNGSGECVEIGFPPAAWHKSSRSNGTGQCVELALTPDVAAVRDSKNPTAGALVLPSTAWTAFHATVRAGEFSG